MGANPQAGLGATAALQDAVALSRRLAAAAPAYSLAAAAAAIGDHTPNPSAAASAAAAVREYEREMAGRAGRVVAASVGNTRRIHEDRPARVALGRAAMTAAGALLRAVDWARGTH